MIRYALKCTQSHSFESWFKSAAAFDTLYKTGHVTCPHCGTSDVAKSLMAPPVTTARARSERKTSEQQVNAQGADAGAMSNDLATSTGAHSKDLPEQKVQPENITVASSETAPATPEQIEASIAKIRGHVEGNSDYVGEDFAKEARAMHDGDSPTRAIYGEANLEEAKALIEDGVPVLPLPFAPKRKLN